MTGDPHPVAVWLAEQMGFAVASRSIESSPATLQLIWQQATVVLAEDETIRSRTGPPSKEHPMPLKAYTLGINGFVGPAIRDALGEPQHRQQARVIIIAATKVAAAELSTKCGIWASATSRETRVMTGWTVANQLREYAAGTPGVFVMPYDPYPGCPVLELHADRSIRQVGVMREQQTLDMGER